MAFRWSESGVSSASSTRTPVQVGHVREPRVRERARRSQPRKRCPLTNLAWGRRTVTRQHGRGHWSSGQDALPAVHAGALRDDEPRGIPDLPATTASPVRRVGNRLARRRDGGGLTEGADRRRRFRFRCHNILNQRRAIRVRSGTSAAPRSLESRGRARVRCRWRQRYSLRARSCPRARSPPLHG